MAENQEDMTLAILRTIREDVAVIKGELADMRRRLIAIEARLDRAECRSSAGLSRPANPGGQQT
jgi:hypothetical protein